MKWEKGEFLQEGKGKSIYAVRGEADLIWMEFKNALTAFNGKKRSSFEGKACLNRDMSSFIFQFLNKKGVKNHFVEDVSDVGMICHRLEIIPLEVVVRNRLSGSTARRFNFPDGKNLLEPLLEFYYKDDDLGDPFMSAEQAVAFEFISSKSDIEVLGERALLVNQVLGECFSSVGIELIDFKLEFGRLGGSFLLGDEISCDSCRLWDKKTGEKMDKDRFRLDLGRVEEFYQRVRDVLVARGF